ncbi:MAG: IS1182 family transposase [Hyphomonadaceae bacterium]|nr:IS1182 family transposase [Hyphomonadaceae bacterium]MBY0565256.1 IS1182 family transposase [Hyphomonadaceae bacterium]
MKRFVEGVARDQGGLFPAHLEDFVDEDNPVRVVDAFVDKLDLRAIGFEAVDPSATGRPGYHPAVLLKLYIYGYLNAVPSSRRLEREAGRNVELMWLTERLAPDHKTIADFRKDHGEAIQQACAQFVMLCRELGLFSKAIVAVDGSKFKAVNSRDNNFTANKVEKRIEQTEVHIARYLTALERADRQGGEIAEEKTPRLKEKIERLRQRVEDLRAMGEALKAAPGGQVSLTDPDARAMSSRGKGTDVVGYNVQLAVDAEHYLILAHEVTNIGNDRAQLVSMGEKARDASGHASITVLADRGYYSGDQIVACDGTGVEPIVPKTETSGGALRGRFTIQDFIYDHEHDRYTCPAGQILTQAKKRSTRGPDPDFVRYRNLEACGACALKPRCTAERFQQIRRWKHDDVLDAMQQRLERMPKAMTIRRRTVEHPFGTIKAWMGATHFLTRTLPKVKTEMSLQVLAYNLKRMMALFGVAPLIKAMAA